MVISADSRSASLPVTPAFALPSVGAPSPFRSFWQAGYECADHVNNRGERVDLLRLTGHLNHPAADFANLAPFGIRTVREGIRWAFVEQQPGVYDWSEVRHRLRAARAAGIQVVWDICHFGYPSDLSPLHPRFCARFEAVCAAFAAFYAAETDETLIVTPVNEVSFISWLGGDAAGAVPFAHHQGFRVKYELIRAFIAGIEAIRAVLPGARILTTEPLINVVPRRDVGRGAHAQRALADARGVHDSQFQSLDMLSGRMCPELGGKPEYLDLLGFNFYYDNQWEHGTGRLPWEAVPRDSRWVPLHELLHRAWKRYGRPVVLSETSHPGHDRPQWWADTAQECRQALDRGVPLLGVCLYPILDRPDWDDLTTWHRAGLWDAVLPAPASGEAPPMVLHEPSATALYAAQRLLPELLPYPPPHHDPVAVAAPKIIEIAVA